MKIFSNIIIVMMTIVLWTASPYIIFLAIEEYIKFHGENMLYISLKIDCSIEMAEGIIKTQGLLSLILVMWCLFNIQLSILEKIKE